MSDSSIVHAHQFDDAEQQHEASWLGMWVFLATEVMFFGGMFLGYTIYRSTYPEAFADASNHLDIWLGTINTAVLIGSSFTMALAVRSAQLGARKPLVRFLILTLVLGALFLGIKFTEYYAKIEEHLVPGSNFSYAGPLRARGRNLFFLLLCHDRDARVAYDYRIGSADCFDRQGRSRTLFLGLQHAGRVGRALLAFRRYRVDIPVSVALSGG